MNLIELHILQSFPVTCLNRDDVGAPKSALFGGTQRARVCREAASFEDGTDTLMDTPLNYQTRQFAPRRIAVE